MRTAIRAGALGILTALAGTILWLQPLATPLAAAAPPATDGDLALVPADAIGFIHIRAADLWKHDIFAGFRQTFERAGPRAIAALDAQFVPKISTFDRATGFLLLDERQQPLPYVVLQFTAPFKPADVVEADLPNANKTNPGGKTVYHGDDLPIELYFPDNTHIMVSSPGAMAQYLKRELPQTGPLTAGLKLAASGKPVVVALNVASLPIPPNALKGLPPEATALLNAEHVTLSLDLAKSGRIDFVASYKSPEQADAAEKAVKTLAAFARKELATVKADLEKQVLDPKKKTPRPLVELPEAVFAVFALGAINQTDELLADPGRIVKRAGNDLTASVPVPKELMAGASSLVAVGAGLLMPAVAKVRMAAARMSSQNNLKQLAIAVHNYEATYGHLPHDITDKNGKPILSWRVAILPFIEQDNVYKKFKLDEPWDSPNNKPLSDLAIKVFMSPQAKPITAPGMTHYKAFAGPGTVFEPGKLLKLTDIPDGTSNTILFVEAGEPIPWAKPGDIPFDPKKPLPKLALPGVPDLVNVAMCDGSVRTMKVSGLTDKKLKALITRDDGEIIDDDK